MAEFGVVPDVRQVPLLPAFPRDPVRTFKLLVGVLDVGKERDAVLGEFHSAAVADEQRSTDCAFQRRDSLADAGRTAVQALRRLREMQLVGDGQETLQLCQVHNALSGFGSTES
jgi:hypothetical protein